PGAGGGRREEGEPRGRRIGDDERGRDPRPVVGDPQGEGHVLAGGGRGRGRAGLGHREVHGLEHAVEVGGAVVAGDRVAGAGRRRRRGGVDERAGGALGDRGARRVGQGAPGGQVDDVVEGAA